MANQAYIQSLIQNLGNTHTAAQANVPSAVNNGNPNTIYNTAPVTRIVPSPVFTPDMLPSFNADLGSPWSAPYSNILNVIPRWSGQNNATYQFPGTGNPPPNGGGGNNNNGNNGGGTTNPVTGGNNRPVDQTIGTGIGGTENGGRGGVDGRGGMGGSGRGVAGSGLRTQGLPGPMGNAGSRTDRDGFYSTAPGLWGISPDLAATLGMGPSGKFSMGQLLDILTEPFFPGDFWNSQTGTFNDSSVAEFLADQFLPGMGEQVKDLMNAFGQGMAEDGDDSNDGNWLTRQYMDNFNNYLRGIQNVLQATMQNDIAKNGNTQFRNQMDKYWDSLQQENIDRLTQRLNNRNVSIDFGRSSSGGRSLQEIVDQIFQNNLDQASIKMDNAMQAIQNKINAASGGKSKGGSGGKGSSAAGGSGRAVDAPSFGGYGGSYSGAQGASAVSGRKAQYRQKDYDKNEAT